MERQAHNCRWKLASHAIGGSIFLQPYAVGLSGIVLFCLIVIMEAWVTGNSLILFYKMTPRGEVIERANYFTIISDHLGDRRRSYKIILVLFVIDVIVCSSFYFKCLSEIIFSTWLIDSSKGQRSALHFRICVGASLFVIVVECVSEKIAALYGSTIRTMRPTYLVYYAINVVVESIGFVVIRPDSDSNRDRLTDNSIDMPAVLSRMHGYKWRRFWLLFIFLFLAAVLLVLYVELRASGVVLVNATSNNCPGLLSPEYFVWPSMKTITAVPIITFSLMQYALFLPICYDELEMPLSQYRCCVRQSSVAFIIIFCTGAIMIHCILGYSAPSLFPIAFGSEMNAFNLKILSILFILVAMLLRIMACCRLIQVLFDFKSEVSYWNTATMLLVTSYLISNWMPSVLYLAIIAGCGTSNLLLIILPRVAYLNFVRKTKAASTNQQVTTDSRDPNQRTTENQESHEASEEPGKWELFQTTVWIGLHVFILLMMIPSIMTVDIDVGKNCHTVFDKLWSSVNKDAHCV